MRLGAPALGALRRGLRMVPDDPELLALLKEIQSAGRPASSARPRGAARCHPQIRAGLDLLCHGRIDESLKVLRAVLHEDPDNARAQAAIQEVRKRAGSRAAAAAAAPPASVARPAPAPPASAVPEPAPAPAPGRPTPASLPSCCGRPSTVAPAAAAAAPHRAHVAAARHDPGRDPPAAHAAARDAHAR